MRFDAAFQELRSQIVLSVIPVKIILHARLLLRNRIGYDMVREGDLN
jgi:hypothetical protein